MANSTTTAELTRCLAVDHRVVVLGGLAVISHGHSRPTYDGDIWLDPGLSLAEWCRCVALLLGGNESLKAVSIGDWKEIPSGQIGEVIQRDGVLRIMGANQPLDIFRSPNELEMSEFDTVWERAIPLEDGTRIPDVIDLLVTKQATGRDKDLMDIAFLETKAEREYLEKLPSSSAPEATAMLDRFLTPKVAESALHHPEESVRQLGRKFLEELAEEGDPYARDILVRIG